MTVIDKRGKEYELEINEDGTVNIFSEEGQNCNVEVSGSALWMLKMEIVNIILMLMSGMNG